MPGVIPTPFPYWHQLGVPKETDPKEMSDFCLYQLELLLAQQSAPRDTAAVLLEPVLSAEAFCLGVKNQLILFSCAAARAVTFLQANTSWKDYRKSAIAKASCLSLTKFKVDSEDAVPISLLKPSHQVSSPIS